MTFLGLLRLSFVPLALASACFAIVPRATALEVKGLAQLSFVDGDSKTSFINSGTGILRYDGGSAELSQGVLELTQDFDGGLTASATFNAFSDGDLHVGLTQALVDWKPLSANAVRFKGRAGFFYPRMSAENTDIGWLSPYTYTPSAINSWIGEEMRIAGLEATLFSPGRSRRSPWSWEINTAVYGGNDPAGSILSWRGFALHARQSLHHDRLQFAPLPSVIPPSTVSGPAWVEPFHEIDGRLGGYIGAHLRRASGPDLRVYYYDNNGNPNELNSDRLYAWDTRFWSLAYAHEFRPGWTLLGQWMVGESHMGDALVDIDFDAHYVMLSHASGRHRWTLRYDGFDVDETDAYPKDPNNSDGSAWTAAWRYTPRKDLEVGVEYLDTRNSAANRPTVGEPINARQQQLLFSLQYRFGG
ncbi:MAG: hypothetical protein AAGG55_13095 [Pseudomonadota bacterium]